MSKTTKTIILVTAMVVIGLVVWNYNETRIESSTWNLSQQKAVTGNSMPTTIVKNDDTTKNQILNF